MNFGLVLEGWVLVVWGGWGGEGAALLVECWKGFFVIGLDGFRRCQGGDLGGFEDCGVYANRIMMVWLCGGTVVLFRRSCSCEKDVLVILRMRPLKSVRRVRVMRAN